MRDQMKPIRMLLKIGIYDNHVLPSILERRAFEIQPQRIQKETCF